MPRGRCNCKEAARALVKAGYSISAAAKILGVSPKTVKLWLGEPKAGVEERPSQPPRRGPQEQAAQPSPFSENLWVKMLRERR